MFSHRLYGCVVHAPVELPAPSAPATAAPDITISTTNNPIRTVDIAAAHGVTYEILDGGAAFVRCHDRFQFSVASDGRRISAYHHPETTQESLFAYLLGHGLSVALLQKGVEGLHAAAIEVDGRGIAIMGDCGFGKSTLAAHAVRGGARLLTDDLLVLNGTNILPGPCRIKLDPEIASTTLGARAGIPMYDERSKWIYRLEEREYSPDAVELSAIYTLQPDAHEIAVERLGQGDAFQALIGATFNPLEQSAPRLASHMRYHAALARSIPVYRLHVPRRITEIAKVIEAI